MLAHTFTMEKRTLQLIFSVTMNPAQTIMLYQPLLQTIAYNLVRCKHDAEDIVQETFVKYLTIDHQQIKNKKAYLITAVRNNCLNHLHSIKQKKEEYLDNVSEAYTKFKENNFSHLDLEIDLKSAMQVLHTKLEPMERAVYLLKEVFDFDYDELQHTLDKKKEHCRQLLCRAKKKLNEETSKISLPDTSKMFSAFREACDVGNAAELVNELKTQIAESLNK